jgi:hypothetical protein
VVPAVARRGYPTAAPTPLRSIVNGGGTIRAFADDDMVGAEDRDLRRRQLGVLGVYRPSAPTITIDVAVLRGPEANLGDCSDDR